MGRKRDIYFGPYYRVWAEWEEKEKQTKVNESAQSNIDVEGEE